MMRVLIMKRCMALAEFLEERPAEINVLIDSKNLKKRSAGLRANRKFGLGQKTTLMSVVEVDLVPLYCESSVRYWNC